MQTPASLNLLNMDSSLLDQNTVSIITSPNKQFYYMAALDSNDLENFCVTREYKLHENALGPLSNDFVNDWHLHSNEQASSDNFTEMTYYKLTEQMPNYGINRFCYPVSSELLAITTQNSLAVSNSCDNLAITQNDPFPGLADISSEAALRLDVAELNRYVSLEGMSQSQTHNQNDVVNAKSFVELSTPADIYYGLQGCYNPAYVKSKQLPRKSVKKSKSPYSSYRNSRKNCGLGLNSDKEPSKQNHIRVKSQISSGNVVTNGVPLQPCNSQLNSHQTLFCHVNIGEDSRSENSDSKGDSESSGNEEDVQTSGITSTGHESAAIDQTWDGYQVPLYVAISDDSMEEKLDATYLQGEWQQLTDESCMDFTDFGNDYSSHSQHQASDLDSDTDAEELHHLIKESSDALRLTRLSLSELKLHDGSMQSSLHREPLATCSTSINCLRDLLNIVSQKDVNQLSDLLKQWEEVKSEFLCLTFRNDLSISHSDVILDVSPDAPLVPPVYQRMNNCSSDIDMTMVESTSSLSCSSKCCNNSFFNRFDVFNCSIKKLLKESSPLHQATLPSIQIVFFIIFLLIFLYFIAFNNQCTDMVGIKFDPQLKYVIGPPPL